MNRILTTVRAQKRPSEPSSLLRDPTRRWSRVMLMMRWFALVVGTVWTVAVFVRMFADESSSATWQQAALGIFLAGSGLYGLLRPTEDEGAE